MTPEEKLAKIAEIFDTRTPNSDGGSTSTHARYNLEGALQDMDQTGRADAVSLKTIRRVINQLIDIETVLKVC